MKNSTRKLQDKPRDEGPRRRLRLVVVFTSSVSVAFYFGLYGYLQNRGIDVSVISSEGPELETARDEGASVFAVPMQREISPGRDLISLWRLWRVIRKIRPDVINVGTPKAGLLGGLAGFLARVPHRVYTLHGLRLETTHGLKRALLTYSERLACYCAHSVHCVSPSLLRLALELKLVEPGKAVLIGPGTSRGVDVAHLQPSSETCRNAIALRRDLGIPDDAPVVGFVGRFTRDKGIPELYQAFVSLKEKYRNMRLLLVGDFETGDPVPDDIRIAIEADQSVIRTGFISDVAPYYHLMDLCVLATYREGFPGVPLEAQAAGVPVITTRATGAIDSVLDQQTGVIVPVGDQNALSAAMDRLLGDSFLRKRMGEAGRAWVDSTFQREVVWAAHAEEYEQLASRETGEQLCVL